MTMRTVLQPEQLVELPATGPPPPPPPRPVLTHYQIVSERYAGHLEIAVEGYMKQGWIPVGGIAIGTASGPFHQAMVKAAA